MQKVCMQLVGIMRFEEEFPSLKGKRGHIRFKVGHQTEVINCLSIEDIQKHCLDKERVREVIDKLSIHNFHTCSEKFKCVTCQLKKELGLK